MKGFKTYAAATLVLASLTLGNSIKVFSQHKDAVPKTCANAPCSQSIAVQTKPAATASKINFDSIAAIYDTPEKALSFAREYIAIEHTGLNAVSVPPADSLTSELTFNLGGRKDSVAAKSLKKAIAAQGMTSITDKDIATFLSMPNGSVKKKTFTDSSYTIQMNDGHLTVVRARLIQNDSVPSLTIQSIPGILRGKKGTCAEYATLVAGILQKNGYEAYILAFSNHAVVVYQGKKHLWGTLGINPVDVHEPAFESVNATFYRLKTHYAYDPKFPSIYICKLPAEVFEKNEGTVSIPLTCLMTSKAGQNGTIIYKNVSIVK